jgi:hypothetical protein
MVDRAEPEPVSVKRIVSFSVVPFAVAERMAFLRLPGPSFAVLVTKKLAARRVDPENRNPKRNPRKQAMQCLVKWMASLKITNTWARGLSCYRVAVKFQ